MLPGDGRDPTSGETILSGLGESHLQLVAERMKRKYEVNIDISLPRVPYRETIRSKAEANRLNRSELSNAPFAISNLSMLGVDQFDGFVFHGQTAVLSVGRATQDSAGRQSASVGGVAPGSV